MHIRRIRTLGYTLAISFAASPSRGDTSDVRDTVGIQSAGASALTTERD